ncbi:glutathione S-transferase family protein [Amorphus orientalis]|uniref:Glutathione S-transferase n=1 Tax=Amorphus orientalis TaxID=649198 RepID=A0AAE3VPH0_9HYPH|nr:glutathione S-transferase family protein [Amorphus orientalis]MDQ0315633.1 glutathione S-transferase [Amorphus orientalis]
MSIVLYDLCGADDRRFSPYCWRVKMALAHKGLPFETRPVPFRQIRDICDGAQTSVPVIEDDGRIVRDSFDIAVYLETTYPELPSLFGGAAGLGLSRFVDKWSVLEINATLVRMIVADIHGVLQPDDEPYFRETREKRFGARLEEVQEGREERLETLRAKLEPARQTLARQPYLSGITPLFADFILFGTLQWARIASPLQILADDDPIRPWFEGCLDLYGGIGRSAAAAA